MSKNENSSLGIGFIPVSARILKMNSEFEVILYYKYVNIDDPEKFAEAQRRLCNDLNLKGRIIVAEEGMNGTLEGRLGDIEKYKIQVQRMPEFADLSFKSSPGNGRAFPKLSVKVRDEIVTSGFGSLNDVKQRVTGKYLQPEELKAWIKSGKEFYIVDMRNDYEQRSGYFEGSILSGVENFRDIPEFIPKIEHLKEKEILTVCTGGVRCEKASGLLLENGFSNVYQLEGGIHKYMEKYPNEDFKGKLYVFDGRLLVGFNTADSAHEIVGRCDKCESPSENYINCRYDKCHKHCIICESCLEKSAGFCSIRCQISNLNIFQLIKGLIKSIQTK